ncbi:hypothetical protein ARMGADRAFT_1018170 [Armillaria gallica]|uniref:DUF6533 domain-containing protein n=1 Tax=Armillaria gallica TaxID=47427 RepID=A0A2H3D7T1_ARMGA|nr:hypothetical protein ARMGADRAFT_1018170 [Armillaria gallica]
MSLTTSSNFSSYYSFIASVTVLVYDLLLLLPTEIDYVWLPRPLLPLLPLFVLNRYWPLINAAISIGLLHNPSAAQCRLLYYITGPLGVAGIFASQAILMIRTYAIWDRHRVVFWCFIGIWIFCFTPTAVSLVIELKTSKFIGQHDHRHTDCLSQSSHMPNFLYIPVLVSETIIASLTFFKGVQYLRNLSNHPFLTELYVSGMLFYACLLLLTLANILLPMWVHDIAPFLSFYQNTFHSILSNRVMLIILTLRHYPTEELYSSDVELPDITSDSPGSRNDVENASGITPGSDGRIQPTVEINCA